jgi:hypothetical protein
MINFPRLAPDYDVVNAVVAEPLAGARPRAIRDVQRGMVIVRMFARFIEAWLPREQTEQPECDCEEVSW